MWIGGVTGNGCFWMIIGAAMEVWCCEIFVCVAKMKI